MKWKKIFTNHRPDKRPISKIYKELIQLNYNKQITQLKINKGPEQAAFQRRHTDGQHAHERVLNITNY